jgi:hypothetical protein
MRAHDAKKLNALGTAGQQGTADEAACCRLYLGALHDAASVRSSAISGNTLSTSWVRFFCGCCTCFRGAAVMTGLLVLCTVTCVLHQRTCTAALNIFCLCCRCYCTAAAAAPPFARQLQQLACRRRCCGQPPAQAAALQQCR